VTKKQGGPVRPLRFSKLLEQHKRRLLQVGWREVRSSSASRQGRISVPAFQRPCRHHTSCDHVSSEALPEIQRVFRRRDTTRHRPATPLARARRGEIPRELGNCSSLVLLSLAANQLQGTIPDAPGSAANQLRYLYLTLNSLVGVVPPSTGNLSSLVLLPFLPKQSGGDLCPISVDELGGNRLQADDDQGWEFLRSLTNCTRKCCC
jgi:hypothetical protein